MAYLTIMAGLIKQNAITDNAFTSPEMTLLKLYGISGECDVRDVVLHFNDYNHTVRRPLDTANAVCSFLKKHVQLRTLEDPSIGIWISDIDKVLDSHVLLAAFDTLTKTQSTITFTEYTADTETIFYREFEVSGYTIRLTVSNHIIWASDAFLSIEIEPVERLLIVERIWLALFNQILNQVLNSYSITSDKNVLTELFKKYRIEIPIE